MKRENQQHFADHAAKKEHLNISKKFIHPKPIERSPHGPRSKSQEERQKKKTVLESELLEVVEYRKEFDIFEDDAYYAEIEMEAGQINFFDQFERGLSVNLLKYSSRYALVSIDLSNFDTFKKKLFQATYLDKVSQISPYRDRIDKYLEESISSIGEDKEFDVEVDFFPKLAEKHYINATEAIRKFLSKSNEKFEKDTTKHSGSDNIFLKMTGHDIKKIGAGVATVSKICAKPEVLVETSESQPLGSNSFQTDVGSAAPISAVSSVNVIDTGIDKRNPWLNGLVTDATVDYSETGSTDNDGHGTFVSGLICHECNNLERENYQPELKVNMAKIMNTRQIGLEEFATRLPTAISDFKRHSKIFNVSINIEQSPSLNEPSSLVMQLCERLDELVRLEDLVICVSAGNISRESIMNFYQCGDQYPTYFRSNVRNVRVLPPANCCNVLSVGSFVAEGKGAQPAQDLDPSPFTRRGLTLNGILKPDVVESGGNCLINDAGMIEMPSIVAVKSLSKCNGDDSFRYGMGTSCASPLVARLAAKILDDYPGASANLIRALLVNSCRELGDLKVPKKFEIDKQKLYGFGQPVEKNALNSFPYRVVLYCEDKIPMNKNHFIDFYVPKGLKKPDATKRLVITLAYNPPVDRTFMPDRSFGGYTRVALRPYLRKRIRSGDDGFSVVPAAAMNEGVSNWTPEYSNCTIKNAVFDWKRLGFGQMWQVKIVPERHGIEQDFEQDYALVITLETDHHGVQMYDRIAAEMRDKVEGIVEEQATESLA